MKVTGFTIIRNALKYDYPIREAILSVLPLCDSFVVAVGKSEDETRKMIAEISPDKIRIVDTIWDEKLREGGRVLAVETDRAYAAIDNDSDWCFYIQGDEVLHEKYHAPLKKTMSQWKDDKRVEGLVFDYVHFYGSYDFIGDSRKWYKNEVRIIRKDKFIYSYKDAQGFRKQDRPLNVKKANASIYHYGWVKHPKFQQQKQLNFNKLWHSDEWVDQNVKQTDEFDYSQIDSLAHFKEEHPLVMRERISKMNWTFSFDPTKRKLSFKNKIHYFLNKYLGLNIMAYKNYRIIR